METSQAGETLPNWDLSDLYPGPDSAELQRDLSLAEEEAQQFNQRYQGRVAELDGPALAAAIAAYERLDERITRVMSYAYLRYAEAVAEPERGRFLQTMQEHATNITTPLIFFTLEINRIPDEQLNRLLDDAKLQAYRPWLREVRSMRDHQLSDEAEKLLHEKSVAGPAAWTRLFDETIADLRVPVGGEEISVEETLNLLSDTDPAKRKEAAESLGRVLGDNGRLFKHITNTLAKDRAIEDTWRGFQRPDAGRNLANHVEDHVVDALVNSVVEAYPRLSHRYYAIKARWLTGTDQMDYWDRLAPLPEDDDRRYGWQEAKDTVLKAYESFSPRFAELGQRFFDNSWIDAPLRRGKAPGAFAHPTVPSAHPYLLLNYQGKRRDVLTLAHELGHGVHQLLAGQTQGHLQAQTPLTLAEMASVFAEMVTFRRLLDSESDPQRRRVMLAGKIEDMLGTVVRQISFYRFEWQVHTKRQEQELSVEEIADIWLQDSQESMGPAVRFHDSYRMFWAYIPHFVHVPFYVYAYAFGDCLVNALYSQYQKAEAGFADKYLDMLAAGGTKHHRDLLAPFGLDASEPTFWQQGLSVIEGLIDELEAEMPSQAGN